MQLPGNGRSLRIEVSMATWLLHGLVGQNLSLSTSIQRDVTETPTDGGRYLPSYDLDPKSK